jgi:hypothetical protein
VEVYRLTGRLCWLIGERERAIQWWEHGILEGERMRARPEVARTYLELGQRLVAAGQGDRRVGNGRAAACVEDAERRLGDLGIEVDAVPTRAFGARHSWAVNGGLANPSDGTAGVAPVNWDDETLPPRR